MIEGTFAWRQQGLNPPAEVIDATNKYLESEDTIAAWIEDRCECKATYQDTAAHLFASWKSHAELMGEDVGSQKALAEKLEGHGMASARIGHTRARGFKGVRVITAEAPSDWASRD
jgi:putative DNA primase/helicase